MRQLGSLRARPWHTLLAYAAIVSMCVTWSRPAVAWWPWESDAAANTVGSPQWWKKHKSEAVFTEGKGFKVEGVDGYFDGDGRPMTSSASVESVIAAGEKTD